MVEHHGNGEHPELQERRRQLRLWGSLLVLSVFGGLLGLVRLVRDLLDDAPPGSIAYQLVLLAVTGLFGLLVWWRLRSLRRR